MIASLTLSAWHLQFTQPTSVNADTRMRPVSQSFSSTCLSLSFVSIILNGHQDAENVTALKRVP